MEEKLDRRVRRTRERLNRALTELLMEKPMREITVRELTDRADVNRGTFYAHYTDLFDMLEQMENEVLAEFEALLGRYAPAPGSDARLPGPADGGPLPAPLQPGHL